QARTMAGRRRRRADPGSRRGAPAATSETRRERCSHWSWTHGHPTGRRMVVMGGVPDDPAADRPREWLALPGGGIRPVVSVPGTGGIANLLAYGAWRARLRPACRCGRPRL